MDSPVKVKVDLTKSSEITTSGLMDIIAKFKDWALLPRQAKAQAKAD